MGGPQDAGGCEHINLAARAASGNVWSPLFRKVAASSIEIERQLEGAEPVAVSGDFACRFRFPPA